MEGRKFHRVRTVLIFCPRCLQLLTNHYEQNWKYYCLPSGMGSFGTASDEELLLTKKLFWGIFDSLSHKVLHFLLFFKTCWAKVSRRGVIGVPLRQNPSSALIIFHHLFLDCA